MNNETQQNISPVQPLPQVPIKSPMNWLRIFFFTILGLVVMAGLISVGVNIGKKQITKPLLLPTEQPTIFPTQVLVTPNSTSTPTCIINGQPCTQTVCPPMPTCPPGRNCAQVMPPCVKYPGICQNGQCIAIPTTNSTFPTSSVPNNTAIQLLIKNGCIFYFDGCNTCRVNNNGLSMCTRMRCNTMLEPKCLEYKN